MTAEKPRDAIVKRSLAINGHRTSISLEQPFFDELMRLAAARGQSLAAIVAEIDAARNTDNLSSAIRLFVFYELKKAAAR